MKHYLRGCLLMILSFCIVSGVTAQNVGVGTSNPVNPFTVRAAGEGITQESADSSTRIGFYVVPHFAYLQTDTKDNLLFSTNNGAILMTLDTLGNLGVGVSAPQARLDVNGSVRLRIGTPVAGQTLTTDGSGNASWQSPAATGVRYTAATNFSIPYVNNPIKSWDTATFSTRYYDPGLLFDGTYYTIPSNGLYHFDVNIFWGAYSQATAYSFFVALATNSQLTQTISTVPANFGGNTAVTLSTDLYLTAGQKVHVELSQSSGSATLTAYSGTSTSFSCHKVY